MNENAKKLGLVAIIVVAVVAAVFGANRLFGEEKMQIDNVVKMPEGHKSEKQQALDAQAAAGGAKTTGGGEERDLGGDLSGK
ncbi:MAG: hypothetical protein IT203_02485 [Fimbriimonadaceae bacterium]|nr:hypothetical protein [Fimbriimonadaceae bacterium]